jgi:calcium-dependent protein kinase
MGACSSKNPSAPASQMSLDGAVEASSSMCTDFSLGKVDSASSAISHAISSIDNHRSIREVYSIDKVTIGVTVSSTVSKGRKRSTGEEYAIKTISKAKAKNFDRIKKEITIMKMLDHDNIVKLSETFEDKRTIRLVMELCTGDQLDERLIEEKMFTENQSCIIMKQIFEAVNYLHSMKICHRDLKPDNILFSRRGAIERSTLKVIDFGSACFFNEGQFMRTKAGSSYYVAPQVLNGKYDKSSDLWSCGVILHIMLCGYPPFYGETEEEVIAKVKRGTFTFDKKRWKKISEDSQILIRFLLKMNPQERCTAQQALEDTWILNKAPKATQEALDNGTPLRRFRSGYKLKKAGLHVIAERLSESQIRSLEKIFSGLDSDADGMLNAKQLRLGLKRVGLEKLPVDIETIIKEVDADSGDNGVVDYKQFVSITLNKKQVMQETICWNAFSDRDADCDGMLSIGELSELLRSATIQEIMGSNAANDALRKIKDGATETVSFDQFMMLFRSLAKL